ncbi:putative uncharacterized protein [Firmicutes bacterium CAG:631]|nr:putative uncharacterized protein [Firmicutes bacterium CAG:631]
MYHFEYVSKNQRKETKKELIKIINLVQDEIRDDFTFRFDFVGSDTLNMVTCDFSSNIGYDFDVDIQVNDEEEKYDAKTIKHILMNAFNKVLRQHNYSYSNCEDSTRVFTIKVKDKENSRILHSCDFAIVYKNNDGSEQYIRFNKEQNYYSWEYQPKRYYDLSKKIEALKNNGCWNEVLNGYLKKKNNNDDPNKKSRSLRAEIINEIYNKYFKD